MHSSTPYFQEAVFVGGGHTHALVLKSLGMSPIAGARITVITDVTHVPYSGMLPGLLTDVYTFDETHIDLRRLCEFAGARFILQKVIGLDLAKHQVLLEDQPSISFDLLSINIGSAPDTKTVPGAAEYAIPVKPISRFLKEWCELKTRVAAGHRPSIIVVGGGAGGVELALAFRNRLGPDVEIDLVHQSQSILNTHTPRVGRVLTDACRQLDIRLHLGEKVTQVTSHGVECKSGKKIAGEPVVWITGASAPSWVADSGLAVDKNGFIRVKNTLQSESHPFVFAAGDIATMTDRHHAKAGVYAVRAAKPLAENLRRYCKNRPLLDFLPQKRFLSLISTSDESAIASRGAFMFHSPLMWKWKDHIDRKFMQQFFDLHPMLKDESAQDATSATSPSEPLQKLQLEAQMRCKGCAAKVGKPALERVLKRLRQEFPDVVDNAETRIGLGRPDDAAVISIPEGKLLVQSIDYLSAIVPDLFLLGRILTIHSFSDIFAMGALPHSATALPLVPFAATSLMEQDIYQCLAGISYELSAMKATLLGGHTAEGAQLGLGLHCNGLAEEGQILCKQGIRSGDRLLLTKPLGIGTLFAAQMRLAAKGRWIDNAIESMLVSNQQAGECLKQFGATACTDITGFGLAGHLMEMLDGTSISVELLLDELPVLEGALEIAQSDLLSSLDPQNRQQFFAYHPNLATVDSPRFDLLFDPQTSGGLLASVPCDRADECLAELQKAGYSSSAIVGIAADRNEGQPPIVLRSGKLQ